MNKLVYSCVFFNEQYLALLNLLLESFTKHNKTTTKYLVIATPRFEPDIQKMFDAHGVDGDVWCINNVYTKFAAACARLTIFSYPQIDDYTTLLYLDTDIIIAKSLDPIFNITLEDKLYCFDAGVTVDTWGGAKKLFNENNIKIDSEQPVFSTCVMLFKNSKQMKSLFSDIIAHIKERVPGAYDLDGAYDEDFVIYQCVVQDCYDMVQLNPFIKSNCIDDDKQMVINHFCASTKEYTASPHMKLDKMLLYLSRVDKDYSRNIIQIGANVGDCSDEAVGMRLYDIFNLVSNNDNCIFIEPVPYLFKQLKANYEEKYPGNDFVFINTAVSDRIGEAEMMIASEKNDFTKLPEWVDKLGSLDPDHISKVLEDDIPFITEKITVPTTTLAEIIKESGMTSIDLLQVDAEGHDLHILGAYDFSIKPQKIIFEHRYMKQGDLATLLLRLRAMGYKQIGHTELDLVMELSN